MKINKGRPVEEMSMNMTPIIDIVFNLVIFFMLATDMTQKELEELVLPKSRMAAKDEGQDKGRVIVNVDRDGTIRVRRQEYDLPELRDYLMGAAAHERDPEHPEYSATPVLVRADYLTEFRFVRDVMEQCASRYVRIRKVQLAAARDRRESE